MTIAKPLPTFVNSAPAIEDTAIPQAAHTEAAYNHVLVLLTECPSADEALRTAVNLAKTHNATLVIVGENQPGINTYIQRVCRDLAEQELNANGYTVSTALCDILNWIVSSEKADAVVVAQQSVNWFGRLLGKDVAAALRQRTTADLFVVN